MRKKNKKNALYQQVSSPDGEYNMAYVFQKSRLITYFALLFCTPYGLWRLYKSPTSELFRTNEKIIWTLVVAVYLSQLVQLLLLT